MSNELTGKWHSDSVIDTVNIFDGEPLRMKISISSSGYYNTKPNCVYQKDGYLCFEINGEGNRMVFFLRACGDKLKGYYTYFGEQTEIEYEKISDTPEDGEYKCRPMELYLPNSDITRLEVLTKFSEYESGNSDIPKTSYVLGGNTPKILKKYGYEEYIKGFGGDALAFRLLDFVCDNFMHNGTKGLGKGRSVEDLIRFCESNSMATNCRGLSIILASLLRLNNIKARHITCMPYEKDFYDCHVVVDCELPSGRRVMLDPTWRLYFKDKNGEYVSLANLRGMLIRGEELIMNPEAGYNRVPISDENKIYYRNYMTKNTFRFSRGKDFADGKDGRSIELIPKGYPTEGSSSGEHGKLTHNGRAFWEM